MAGINDLSFTSGPTQGGIKPNALAGSWGGGSSFSDPNAGPGTGANPYYPDWRRFFGGFGRWRGGELSRTNAAQPMPVAQDVGRPMSQAAPTPSFAAPMAPEPMAAPSAAPGFVGDRSSPAQGAVQPNALWNSGIRSGGFLR